MKKLLTSPSGMLLTASEVALYQKILTEIAPLSLNFMAVKVNNHPSNFKGWCIELLDICLNRINKDLMETSQDKPLKKLINLLSQGVSLTQITIAKQASWSQYYSCIQSQSQLQSLEERLRLLTYTKQLNEKNLGALNSQDMMVILGKHTSAHSPQVYDFDVEWFGSTKLAKGCHELLTINPLAFDQALAAIPSTGEVSQLHYEEFVAQYASVMIQANETPSLLVATRLLAMKRPDTFLVITTGKLDVLCQGLGIARFKMTDFASYWQELITVIHSTQWYQAAQPDDEAENRVWQARVILMDVLYWANPLQAQQSNYLKLLNKPTKKSTVVKRAGRSKESAEVLVDRVLAADTTPQFLQVHRASIIKQVQSGKNVNDVIELLSKVFNG